MMAGRTLKVVSEYLGEFDVIVPEGGTWDTIDNVLTVRDGRGDVVRQIKDWKSAGWVH